MSKKSFEYLEKFLNCDGPSGYENGIAESFKKEAIKNGAEVSRDGFGSVVAKIGQNGPKVMIAAHMDEVAFMVQRIEKTGFLRISTLGGFWMHTVLGNRVKLINREGKVFVGVIGSDSVHVLPAEKRTKVMELKDIYLDLGFNSDEEIAKAGIDVGDIVVNISEAILLGDGDKYMAKAIDNRVGVAVAAKVIENLSKVQLKCQFFSVATAQEEVGCRGGKTSTNMIQPDIAIAIDTTVAHDTPGIVPGDTKVGKGVAITVKSASSIAHIKLVNTLMDLAKDKKIPAYRTVSQGGGDDSSELQFSQAGIPCLSISIPTRYLHTPNEVGSTNDFEAVSDLITEWIKAFDANQLDSFKYK